MKKITAIPNTEGRLEKSGNSASNLYASPWILVPSLVKYGVKFGVAVRAMIKDELSDRVSSVEGIAPEGRAGYVMPALTYITAFAMLASAYQISQDSCKTVLKKLSVAGFSLVAMLDMVNASLTIVAKDAQDGKSQSHIESETPSDEVVWATYLGAGSVASFGLYSLSQVGVKGVKLPKKWTDLRSLSESQSACRKMEDNIESVRVLLAPKISAGYEGADAVNDFFQDLRLVQDDMLSRANRQFAREGLEVGTNASIVAGEVAILCALMNAVVSTISVVNTILVFEFIALLGTAISLVIRNKETKLLANNDVVRGAMQRLEKLVPSSDQLSGDTDSPSAFLRRQKAIVLHCQAILQEDGMRNQGYDGSKGHFLV